MSYEGGPGVGPCDDCSIYALLKPYDYRPFPHGAILPLFLCDVCHNRHEDDEE